MKKFIALTDHGFSLLELMIVLSIIGILVTIAVPNFKANREKAYEAECKANRYHIELEETAYYNEHNNISLSIGNKYKCPSGGVYIWLVSDPEDTDYPKIGCSLHEIGLVPQESYSSITKILDELINYIEGLELNKGITNNLVSRLKSTRQFLDQADELSAKNELEGLIKYIDNQKGKKIPENAADYIIQQIGDITDTITE